MNFNILSCISITLACSLNRKDKLIYLGTEEDIKQSVIKKIISLYRVEIYEEIADERIKLENGKYKDVMDLTKKGGEINELYKFLDRITNHYYINEGLSFFSCLNVVFKSRIVDHFIDLLTKRKKESNEQFLEKFLVDFRSIFGEVYNNLHKTIKDEEIYLFYYFYIANHPIKLKTKDYDSEKIINAPLVKKYCEKLLGETMITRTITNSSSASDHNFLDIIEEEIFSALATNKNGKIVIFLNIEYEYFMFHYLDEIFNKFENFYENKESIMKMILERIDIFLMQYEEIDKKKNIQNLLYNNNRIEIFQNMLPNDILDFFKFTVKQDFFRNKEECEMLMNFVYKEMKTCKCKISNNYHEIFGANMLN